MKKEYKVEWHDPDLYQVMIRRFFTKIGAKLFFGYLENVRFMYPIISRIK